MLYLSESYGSLPEKPGVYEFLTQKDDILYVGKAKNLKNRVSSYFANPSLLYGKTKVLVAQVKKIRVTIVDSELESLLLEAALIKKHTPKYNIRLIDGKSYPLIRVTRYAPFPSVVTARRMDDPKSLYFGPYP
ncbi:MAG: GIY-YIG nuclease family protein, partial [Patescibacteria group bacterium]|nr:GIY-YIG nuclease family protein [Patescibacteria group bacterium]